MSRKLSCGCGLIESLDVDGPRGEGVAGGGCAGAGHRRIVEEGGVDLVARGITVGWMFEV